MNSEPWMFIQEDRIKWFTREDQQGILLAVGEELAMETASWLQQEHGEEVSCVKVGNLAGETIESLIKTSFEEGANSLFNVVRMGPDGPEMRRIPME